MKKPLFILMLACCTSAYGINPITINFDTASKQFEEFKEAIARPPKQESGLWKETDFSQAYKHYVEWTYAQRNGSDVTLDLRGYSIDATDLFSSFTNGNKHALPQNGVFGPLNRRLQVFLSDNIQQTDSKTFLVYGSTKRANQVHDYTGTITIDKILKTKKADNNAKDTLNHVLIGHYVLEEDPSEEGSGIFQGTFCATLNVEVRYDFLSNKLMRDIWVLHDDTYGYSNRNFVGTWTSHNTGETLKAIWGDNALPFPLDFAIGVGVKLNEKYIDNDWHYYQHPEKEQEDVYDEEGNPSGKKQKVEWWKK